ncbi:MULTISPECIES: exopolysaccharide biosynthesis protein [unclassified Devosia]|uniref:exopolysaccharide biosynthesis protein n=1 Tax=unclassified Devosia TaxID=196773 RepID=UPI001554FE9A|nr:MULTISPECIES: exopolysaccharide biosynthesis protein [unclassified Devosia]
MPLSPHASPVELQLDAMRQALHLSASGQAPELTFSGLIQVLGVNSHTLIIFVFSLLNMIPGAPGYGGVVALAMFGFAMAMLLGRPVRLPRFVGDRRVPVKLLLKLLARLLRYSRALARISFPRFRALVGTGTGRPFALIVMVLCLPMVVPIPFMNAIPNVGVAVMCLSRLNRDGLGLIIGVLIGAVGFLVDAWVIWTVISLGFSAGGFLRG